MHKMYVLASEFFQKDNKYYLKLEICVVCREFLAFKYVFIFFSRNKSDNYLYLYFRNIKNSRLKLVFRYTISICMVENTKWILCCRKIVINHLNVQYLRFLMHKTVLYE